MMIFEFNTKPNRKNLNKKRTKAKSTMTKAEHPSSLDWRLDTPNMSAYGYRRVCNQFMYKLTVLATC